MIRFKTLLIVGTAMAAVPTVTLAQVIPGPPASAGPAGRPSGAPASQIPTTPPQKAEPAASTVEDVVVTARTTDVRTSIDSISYSLADDLQSATGTLADALRNVPSVEVDSDGNVSLRGDPNVTILIDGRPATQFNGPSRGQLVQQLPADTYARIEVMTNPSAAFSPEGSGGIINLISRPRVTRPGATTTGSVRANVGGEDRLNLGAGVVHTRDKLTLSADASVRRDPFIQEMERLRTRLDPASGRFLEARQSQTIDGPSNSGFVRLAAEYRLGARTQLTGEVRHTDVDNTYDAFDVFEADDASGGTASAYRRTSNGGFAGQFSGGSARVLRRFDDDGHEWSNEVRLDRARTLLDRDTLADRFIPAAPVVYERSENRSLQDQWGVTSAYVRPMADGSRLRAGYELERIALELGNLFLRGSKPDGLAPDPLISNDFHLDRTVHAVYVTYERPFGEKLSAQFGLRLEQTNLDLDQITTGIRATNDYFRAYPTLNLSYQLNAQQTLRGSYSRRIQRPQPFDLNPFLTYVDPVSFRSGNPDLLPQETDALEVMWQRRVDQTFYQATLYYRDTQDAFTPVTTDLGGGVLLTRPENLGARTATGLELVANGALHPKLRYNASINLSRQQIDAAGLAGGTDREGDSVSGRLTLNWQPTQADFLQVSGVWTGEQLLAQGVRDPSTIVNLGYRRKLTPAWSLQATVRDLFDDFGDTTTLETPTFTDRTSRTFGGRTIYIGFTWNFGQGPQRPDQFDYSAPQGGG